MTGGRELRPFHPRGTLGALQMFKVQFVLIGGLARVLRGSDEVTSGVDICPAMTPANVARLQEVLAQIQAVRADGRELAPIGETLAAEPVTVLLTRGGELKLIPTPAGAPRGYDALRPGATVEHLGRGVRAAVASTGDLVAMSAALGRAQDLERLPRLRRILELEAHPAALVNAAARPSSQRTVTAPPAPYQSPHRTGPDLDP